MTTLQVPIIIDKPPVYDRIIQAGMIFNANSTIFAYNGAIYNPADLDLPQDIIVHEMVHLAQQGDTEESATAWWDRYILDVYFRIQQEIEAYGAQYRYAATIVKDRNRRYSLLRKLAESLSGPMYGNAIPFDSAITSIKKQANI